MTIAVAIRTGSAVVFAADSKLTTSGVVGFHEDGSPQWEEQTYDNATKVVQNRTENLMAMVAGHANIGRVTATDFIMTRGMNRSRSDKDQDQIISDLVAHMEGEKRAYWESTKVAPKEWPGPVVLLAAPSLKGGIPRVWRVDLYGAASNCSEILKKPEIRLEGRYNEVIGLLYGHEPNVLEGIADQAGITKDRIWEVVTNLKVLRPIEKLNLQSIPIQDAIDLAVFLATVQVEMDRFLPGTPACGGPIDVMALKMAPRPVILSFPGKTLRHPLTQ